MTAADVRVAAVFLLLFTGCSSRSVRQSGPPGTPAKVPDPGTYTDLQPGWRLSVISPVLRSGKQMPAFSDTENTGAEVTLKADANFIGYEQSYYSVVSRRDDDGAVVRFSSAALIVDGKASPTRGPRLNVFRLPRDARHIRLIYLLRASKADHNMAVVAADDRAVLNDLTAAVQHDPVSGCRSGRGHVCQWIPAGIAVRPEKRRPGSTSDWIPAR